MTQNVQFGFQMHCFSNIFINFAPEKRKEYLIRKQTCAAIAPAMACKERIEV